MTTRPLPDRIREALAKAAEHVFTLDMQGFDDQERAAVEALERLVG